MPISAPIVQKVFKTSIQDVTGCLSGSVPHNRQSGTTILAIVTCLRVNLAAAPEAGLTLPHSMRGNGDVCIAAAVGLQQVPKVLQP